jgi:hypothetical protein
MAQFGRAGLLQLLRGTREPREPSRVPGPVAGPMVANPSPPEPAAPPPVDSYACAGPTMVSSTACAPSLSRSSLRRQSSEIRTGCANERPSGSVEGVASNRDPYSDLKIPLQNRGGANRRRKLVLTPGLYKGMSRTFFSLRRRRGYCSRHPAPVGYERRLVLVLCPTDLGACVVPSQQLHLL